MALSKEYQITDIPHLIKKHGLTNKCIKSVTVLLGETGKGKSTLAEFLSGSDSLTAEGEEAAYYIVDKNNLISNADETILSHTLCPNVIQLNSNGEWLLDCPGFLDTRSISMEIVCAILMKKALENCENMKIVCVAAHKDVIKGGERKSFMNLAKQVCETIPNLGKFSKSVALVATKVSNTASSKDGALKYDPDTSHQANIKNFLVSTRKTIKEELEKSDSKDESEVTQTRKYQSALNLIDILLQRESIGLFREPTNVGPLREMDLLKECKKSLLNIVNEKLSYTRVTKEDFGYSVSSEAKLEVTKQVKAITKQVEDTVSTVFEKIIRFYEEEEKKNNDSETLYVFIEKHLEMWKNWLTALQGTNDTIEVLGFILNNFNAMAEETPFLACEQEIESLLGFIDLLNLLEEITNQKFEGSITGLTALYNRVTTLLQDSEGWYGQLKYIIREFTNYASLKEVNLAENLFKILDSNKSNESILQELKENLKSINSAITLNTKHLNSTKLDRLKKYCKYFAEDESSKKLQEDITARLTKQLENNEVRCTGHNIVLSKVYCPETAEKLTLFASHKVFIDCDFIRTDKQFTLEIIAPLVEVIGGPRNIILGGQSGKAHIRKKARSGVEPGDDGNDGLVGLPGECGGNFCLYANEMINYESLKISVKGGDGADGQDGGDGADGLDGEDIDQSDLSERQILSYARGAEEIPRGRLLFEPPEESFFGKLFRKPKPVSTLEIYGWDGQRGGDGGDGGEGGAGGYAGVVKYKIFKKECNLDINQDNGNCGKDGLGGSGGQGGKHGRGFLIQIEPGFIFSNIEKEKQKSRGRAENGSPGESGNSCLESVEPECPAIMDVCVILQEYKNWFSSAPISNLNENESTDFFNQLVA